MATVNPSLDRIARLTTYIEKMKTKLGNVPLKHENRKEVYFAFVNLEIRKAQATIDKLKL